MGSSSRPDVPQHGPRQILDGRRQATGILLGKLPAFLYAEPDDAPGTSRNQNHGQPYPGHGPLDRLIGLEGGLDREKDYLGIQERTQAAELPEERVTYPLDLGLKKDAHRETARAGPHGWSSRENLLDLVFEDPRHIPTSVTERKCEFSVDIARHTLDHLDREDNDAAPTQVRCDTPILSGLRRRRGATTRRKRARSDYEPCAQSQRRPPTPAFSFPNHDVDVS